MTFLEPVLRAYQALFLQQNLLGIFFTVFSLTQLRHTVRILRQARQRWSELSSPPLTAWKSSLLDDAAIYVATPLSILLHELGHALAVWFFGGRVVEFGFFVFWGYVLPDRPFPPIPQWIISSAGTWMSLLFGVGVWLVTRRSASPVWQYAGLRTLRFQLLFALVLYPAFTALFAFGDWRIIYNFRETPALSGVTALLHAVALGALWRWEWRGGFERVTHESLDEAEQYGALRAEAQRTPTHLETQLELLRHQAQGQAPHTALAQGLEVVRRWPASAEAHYLLGMIIASQRRRIPTDAARHLHEAITLGLSQPVRLAVAHRLLGLYQLDLEKRDEALTHLDHALGYAAAARQAGYPAATLQEHVILYWRSMVQRQKGRLGPARQDLLRAIELAERAGLREEVELYREQLRQTEERKT